MTIAFARTIILYIVVIFALRLMGKRQIGELSSSELVVTILISDLAAIPMQDPGISILNGIVPILTLLCLEILVSTVLLKLRSTRKALVGSGSILVTDGVINQDEIRRLRITADELIEELRLKDHPDITYVKYAILETNGKISVVPSADYSQAAASCLPITIISDGKLDTDGLKHAKKDEAWLEKTLKKHRLQNAREVFLMQYVPDDGRIILMPKTQKKVGHKK